MNKLTALLVRLLRDLADKIDCGDCEMTSEEIMTALDTLEQYDKTTYLSKEQACMFLKLSRSAFDDRVRYGLIPRGKKVSGFKELFWKKSDLIAYDIRRQNEEIK